MKYRVEWAATIEADSEDGAAREAYRMHREGSVGAAAVLEVFPLTNDERKRGLCTWFDMDLFPWSADPQGGE